MAGALGAAGRGAGSVGCAVEPAGAALLAGALGAAADAPGAAWCAAASPAGLPPVAGPAEAGYPAGSPAGAPEYGPGAAGAALLAGAGGAAGAWAGGAGGGGGTAPGGGGGADCVGQGAGWGGTGAVIAIVGSSDGRAGTADTSYPHAPQKRSPDSRGSSQLGHFDSAACWGICDINYTHVRGR